MGVTLGVMLDVGVILGEGDGDSEKLKPTSCIIFSAMLAESSPVLLSELLRESKPRFHEDLRPFFAFTGMGRSSTFMLSFLEKCFTSRA